VATKMYKRDLHGLEARRRHGMRTLARAAKLIERDFGHRFSISHVWQVLRDLGFASQRPVGRALRSEVSIAGQR
jgi:transposase